MLKKVTAIILISSFLISCTTPIERTVVSKVKKCNEDRSECTAEEKEEKIIDQKFSLSNTLILVGAAALAASVDTEK